MSHHQNRKVQEVSLPKKEGSSKRFANSEYNFLMALIEKMDKTEDPVVKQAIAESIESRSPFKKTQTMLSKAIFKTWSVVILSLMIVAVFDNSGDAKYIMGQIMYVIESKTFWIPVSAVLGTYFVTGILDTVKHARQDSLRNNDSPEKEVIVIQDGKKI